jgi:hypothetical protein
MSRVLALIGAICLIAAAIVARAVVSDDGDDDAGSDDGDALVVACIPELAEACEAIDRAMDLTIEDPGETIARLAAGEDIDAWVTLDPWPTMAEIVEDRVRFDDRQAVARTELTLLARASAVPDGCVDLVAWTCLIDELGDRVAIPEPSGAVGALVLGQAAADFFGSDAVAANDFSEADLARRLDAIEVDDDPFGDMRVGLPEPAATGILAIDLDSLGARRGDFVDSPSSASASVAIVVVGARADRVAGEPTFVRALEAAGWTVDPAASTTGLPNPGVLVALQDIVR